MVELRNACLWEESTSARLVTSRLTTDTTADVCVIGGGITGLSTALHLLQHGLKVVVLEAFRFGTGGSGRNVGLVNAGTWIPPDEVERTLGPLQGSRLNSLLGDAPGVVFDLIRRFDIACQAHADGTLHMAHNLSGVDDLKSRCEQWRRRGANVELLTAERCKEYCGTDKIEAALLDHRAGTIDPMGYTIGLAKAVVKLGGVMYQESAVTGLTHTEGGWRVSTAGGAVQAHKVVISTGAYTAGDWEGLQRNYFRGYYYNVASIPLDSDEALKVLPFAKGSWDTRTVLSSIRRDDEGRLILGSLGKMDNKPAWFVRRWADRIQQHYFPKLGRVEWDCHWTGCIDFTPDHLLRLFEPAPGLVAANGYNGRGNTTGTVIGKVFADYLISGQRETLPVPFSEQSVLRSAAARSVVYEAGFDLYHAGQCLKVLL
jgi:glycine/D-amino acid oxidase-like deaminating enzyme